MEDTWDSQMMMGVGMGDLRGMGSMQQQPSCSRHEMHQEMSIASPEQEMQHQEVMGQPVEYFGNQVSGMLGEAAVVFGDATSGKRRDEKHAALYKVVSGIVKKSRGIYWF